MIYSLIKLIYFLFCICIIPIRAENRIAWQFHMCYNWFMTTWVNELLANMFAFLYVQWSAIYLQMLLVVPFWSLVLPAFPSGNIVNVCIWFCLFVFYLLFCLFVCFLWLIVQVHVRTRKWNGFFKVQYDRKINKNNISNYFIWDFLAYFVSLSLQRILLYSKL